jgi:hypothetical protein
MAEQSEPKPSTAVRGIGSGSSDAISTCARRSDLEPGPGGSFIGIYHSKSIGLAPERRVQGFGIARRDRHGGDREGGQREADLALELLLGHPVVEQAGAAHEHPAHAGQREQHHLRRRRAWETRKENLRGTACGGRIRVR